MKQIVVDPVPQIIPLKRISERIVKQNVDEFMQVIPQERISERIQGHVHDGESTSSSAAVPLDTADVLGIGVFALFPRPKKVRRTGPSPVRPWVRSPAHGLRRLMRSPWRSTRTNRRRSRSRGWGWRMVRRLALQLAPSLGGSAGGSSSTRWDGQCGAVPMATGAPSRTHGLSFTRKLQPMSENSPRTSRSEDVVAASGSRGVVWWRTGGWRRRGAAGGRSRRVGVGVGAQAPTQ